MRLWSQCEYDMYFYRYFWYMKTAILGRWEVLEKSLNSVLSVCYEPGAVFTVYCSSRASSQCPVIVLRYWPVASVCCVVIAVPTNGLVVYCGTVMTEEGKEKKVNIDFEPFRPINTSLYLCDNKFHTEVSQMDLVITMSYNRIIVLTKPADFLLFFKNYNLKLKQL